MDARAVMSASVSQSPSKGGALAGYETVLRVKEGFPLRQEYLGETCSRLGFAGGGMRGNTNICVISQQSRCSLALEANKSSVMSI